MKKINLLVVLSLVICNQVFAQFGEQTLISNSAYDAQCVISTDVDFDGFIDIVSASVIGIVWHRNDGNGVFGPQQVISLEEVQGKSIYAADINGDNITDLVYAYSNKIAWFQNDGSGNFSPMQLISTYTPYPYSVIATDLDNDDDLDVISVSFWGDEIVWFPNDGTGVFGQKQIVSSDVYHPNDVCSADIDNDGDMDIIAAIDGNDKTVWFQNDGLGNFGSMNNITFIEEASFVTAYDFDNDGNIDILTGGRNWIKLCKNDGVGSFVIDTVNHNGNMYKADEGCFADINGDGHVDILVSKFLEDIVLWFENDGFGNYGASRLVTIVTLVNSFCSADFDSDGDMDVVSAGDYKIVVDNNDGSGDFGNKHTVLHSSQAKAYSVHVTDFDNDGHMDMLMTDTVNNQIVLMSNDSLGNFVTEQLLSNYDKAWLVFSADLTGNGSHDIITSSSSGLRCYQNDGSNNFGTEQIINSNIYNTIIDTADFDGDGNIDILIGSSVEDKIAWYQNDGSGNFGTELIIYDSAYNVVDIHVVDIDNDSDMDLVSVSLNYNEVSLFENDGTGNFAPKNVIASLPTGGGNVVSAADFNGDGNVDIIGSGDNASVLCINDGANNFDIRRRPYGAESIDVIDKDGDGDMDLLLCDDYAVWYYNDGNGDFINREVVTGLNAKTAGYANDIDSDGDIDVLAVSRSYDKIAWYENSGTSVINPQQVVSSVPNVDDLYAVDIDGDGNLDVLSNSKWYKNNGYTVFDSVHDLIDIYGIPSTVFPADINSDGIIDVLACNRSEHAIFWYKNNGAGNLDMIQVVTNTDSGYYDKPDQILAADFDSDGALDVLAYSGDNNSDRLFWFRNDGNGNFGTKQVINQDIMNYICVSDIDTDGDIDIITSNSGNDKIAWYQNDGLGNFGYELIITTEAISVEKIISIDFDGDGDIDILYIRDSGFAWLQNDGLGNFGTEQIISSNNPCDDLFPEDVDGDGDLDVVTILNNDLAWFENLGNEAFGPPYVIPTIDLPTSIFVADLNNDGSKDVLSARSYNYQIAWHRNFYNSPYQIKGNIFYDSNQNGERDSLDHGLLYLQTELQPDGLASFTNQEGEFQFAVDTGNYIVSYNNVQGLSNWSLTTDSTEYNVNISTTEPIIDSLNFGFYPNNYVTNISTDLTRYGCGCGVENNLWLSYRNIGTSIPQLIIELELDTQIIYMDAPITPDSIVCNRCYWHYDSLSFFEFQQLKVTVLSPDYTSMGDILTSVLNIYATDSTGQTLLFTDYLIYESQCSYDPNDKLVSPKGEGMQGIISIDDTLEFTIRFQNTGNAEAINVRILDEIDENLDIDSIQIIASSHNVQSYIQQDRWLVFRFDSIMLPDSSSNLLESQGFVKYRISIKDDVLPNKKIYNTASIYFDNNPAVVTNTTMNTIDCYIVPEVPELVQTCDLLHVSTDNEIHWFLNGTEIGNVSGTSIEYLEEGDYSYTIIDENRCFANSEIYSVVSLYNTGSDIRTACDSYTWIDGITYTASNNTATYTLTNTAGCDSIVTLDLTINNNTGIDQQSACDSYIWIDGNTYTESNSTATYSLTNSAGCDSVVKLELTINSNTGVDQQTGCDSFAWIDGNTYTENNNTATYTLSNVAGCDSVVTLNLTMNSVDVNITNTDTSITAVATDALYQWLDCNDSTIIIGATGQTFYPVVNGNYTVAITENSCVDTSICVTISKIGISEVNLLNQVSVYPNPTSGIVNIELGNLRNVTVKVFNSSGMLVYEEDNICDSIYKFELSESSGAYIIEISEGVNKLEYRLIKK